MGFLKFVEIFPRTARECVLPFRTPSVVHIRSSRLCRLKYPSVNRSSGTIVYYKKAVPTHKPQSNPPFKSSQLIAISHELLGYDKSVRRFEHGRRKCLGRVRCGPLPGGSFFPSILDCDSKFLWVRAVMLIFVFGCFCSRLRFLLLL